MKERIIKEIRQIIIPESCIGVHGITKSHDVSSSARRILQNGLNNYYRGGLNSNCTIFGQIETFDFSKVLDYSYYRDDNDFYGNIIIAIPNIIYDINDNRYFIGPFEDNYLGNNDERILKACKHPFNSWINDKKNLRPEFIVGAYIKKENQDSCDFILNENYIGLKSEDERKVFFESIKQELSRHGLKSLDEGYIFIDKNSFYGHKLIEYLNKKNNKDIIKKVISI